MEKEYREFCKRSSDKDLCYQWIAAFKMSDLLFLEKTPFIDEVLEYETIVRDEICSRFCISNLGHH